MSVTYVDFQPSDIAPFQFAAILDGTQYNIVCTYNIFGQRYYINIYTNQGALVVSRPMIGSPTGYDISMTAGYFTSTLVYRTENNQFEISSTPITYPNFGARPAAMLDVNLGAFILDQSVLGDGTPMLGNNNSQLILNQSQVA